VTVKAKLLPLAMIKAKQALGDSEWSKLSSAEKTNLTEIKLMELVSS
jgi:hypothetical protein